MSFCRTSILRRCFAAPKKGAKKGGSPNAKKANIDTSREGVKGLERIFSKPVFKTSEKYPSWIKEIVPSPKTWQQIDPLKDPKTYFKVILSIYDFFLQKKNYF